MEREDLGKQSTNNAYSVDMHPRIVCSYVNLCEHAWCELTVLGKLSV